MAKVIRDGPELIAGVAVTRLIDVQGSEQVKNFLHRMRSNSQAQKLLVIACSWAQHQYRWNTYILEDVNSHLSQFEAQWLKALRRYLKWSNSQLELEKTYVYLLQRINDKYIMLK
eukprot:7182424-Ditylum_brightwellii.AAC.1